MTVDELEAYGMVRMTSEEVDGFLASQRVGVLGLPGDDGPSMRPMSYGYDGEDTLYMLFVLGDESRKDELSRQSDVARFLVYRADSPYNWQSVLLSGRLATVDDDEADEVVETVSGMWRPDVFEAATEREVTRLYRFEVESATGLKHVGLPPDYETE